MTYREQFESALRCKTKAQALGWLKKEIARLKNFPHNFDKSDADIRRNVLENLGYLAGYYDETAARKVYELFGAEHPIFGHPDYWKNLSPDYFVRIGIAQAQKEGR